MAKRKLPQAPWQQEQQQKTQEHPKMLLCHFQNGELEGLDNLQGGPSVDPATGVREYSRLAEIIKIPEVRKIFMQVKSDLSDDGKLSPQLHGIYEQARHHSLPFRQTHDETDNGEPDNDAIRALEKMGRGGDSKVAWIPINLAEFLIELRPDGKPSVNPKSGLLEFGIIKKAFGRNVSNFLRNVTRIAGTTAGAMLGGPLGAAAGRTLAGLATGQSFDKSLDAGLSHAGRAAFVSGAGGVLGQLAPGLAGSIGGMGSNILGPSVSGMAGNFFNGPMSTMGMGKSVASSIGLGGVGGAAANGSAAPAIAGAAKTGATSGPFGSYLGSLLSSPMAMVGGIGALSYLGSRKQHKQDERAYEDNEKRIDKYRNEMGFNKEWKPIETSQRKHNPEFYKKGLNMSGAYSASPYLDDPVSSYKKGGAVMSYDKGTLVKGQGKGQDDKIKTFVPEGSYIIDASSTSMFGDGSSEAGALVLKRFENQIKRGVPKGTYMDIERKVLKTSPQLPVYLSNDEYKFDPISVSILGGGSNVKGAQLLKKMVKNLRAHKNSNGNRLPPQAKSPEFYIKGR